MFREISLEDKSIFDEFVYPNNPNHSQYNFTTLYMWKHELKPKIAVYKNLLCIYCTYYGHKMAFLPIGKDFTHLKEACDLLIETIGEKITFVALNEEKKQVLLELYPGKMKFYSSRANEDYVYLAESLISLSGKKLHSKKNHINNFVKNNSFQYKTISQNLIADCEKIEKDWLLQDEFMNETDKKSEYLATMNVLWNFDYLKCRGGIIYINGEPKAFSVGEMMKDDMAIIHIEKADKSIVGLYPIINQFTVKNEFSEAHYINREEDMGIDALRKAKLSYHPYKMLKADRARFIK